MSDLRTLTKIRHQRAEAAKPVIVTRLKKDGTPSKAHDATCRFNTLKEAVDYVARLEDLNPKMDLKFRLEYEGWDYEAPTAAKRAE